MSLDRMRIYLDACCLNRPFDDQNQERIRLESEAVLVIVNRFLMSEWEWIGSEILEIELKNTPNIEKRNSLMELLKYIHKTVILQENIIKRSQYLIELGFKNFDALHIACAESDSVDIFLTTDDQVLKLANKVKNEIKITLANPMKWIMEFLK